jgi:hypothetical protein
MIGCGRRVHSAPSPITAIASTSGITKALAAVGQRSVQAAPFPAGQSLELGQNLVVMLGEIVQPTAQQTVFLLGSGLPMVWSTLLGVAFRAHPRQIAQRI